MKRSRDFVLWYVLAGLLVGIFILPAVRPSFFEKALVLSPTVATLIEVGLIVLCPIAAWLALAGEPLSRKGRLGVTFLVLSATALCEVVHYWVTDRGHYFSAAQFGDNTVWQQWMHQHILALEYGALPHSYRFLPDSIVELYRWLCGDFVIARIAYRVLFNAILFVGVYRYARVFVSELFAGLAVLIITVIYPITILKYAGQFVDPMANGFYALCLYFLAAGYEPGFGPTLFTALMAKESVIVVAFCRLFYGRPWWRGLVPAALYCAGGVAILYIIRRKVSAGHLEYNSISGVDLKHVADNLRGWREWILMYVTTFGALLPGAILGWRRMDRPFQLTAVTVILSSLVSSIFFSWLSEVRNMTPAFIVLTIVNVVYLEHVFRSSGVGANATKPRALDETARA